MATEVVPGEGAGGVFTRRKEWRIVVWWSGLKVWKEKREGWGVLAGRLLSGAAVSVGFDSNPLTSY
jgi:hypothetical protein